MGSLRTRVALTICIGVASCMLGRAAVAGNFEVSPIRLDFDAGTRSSVLTIRNDSAEDTVVIQAKVFKWTQQDGRELTTPTTDLIVNPPIFTLKSGALQIVRVGPRASALTESNRTELSYRIVLAEVPKQPSAEFRGVGVALSLSIPIFFPPKETADQPLPAIDASRDADGRVIASVNNTGTRSFKVIKVTLTDSATQQPLDEVAQVRYLLANSKFSWTFRPPLPAPANFTVSVLSDRGVHSIDVKERRIDAAANTAATSNTSPSSTTTSPQ